MSLKAKIEKLEEKLQPCPEPQITVSRFEGTEAEWQTKIAETRKLKEAGLTEGKHIFLTRDDAIEI